MFLVNLTSFAIFHEVFSVFLYFELETLEVSNDNCMGVHASFLYAR